MKNIHFEYPKIAPKNSYLRMVLKSNIAAYKTLEIEGLTITQVAPFILSFQVTEKLMRRVKIYALDNNKPDGSTIYHLTELIKKSKIINYQDEFSSFFTWGSYWTYGPSASAYLDYDDKRQHKSRQRAIENKYRNKISNQVMRNNIRCRVKK